MMIRRLPSLTGQKMTAKRFGIDINFYCEIPDKNNIIPMVRVLEARPAEIPQWIYDKGLIFDYNRAPCAVNY